MGDNGSGSRVVLMMNDSDDTAAEGDADDDWMFCLLSLVLWEFCVKPFDHIQLLNMWPSTGTQLSKQSWTYKSTFFLFWYLSVANSSLATVGALWVPSLSMLGFCLTWAGTVIMHLIITTVSSYLQWPMCVLKTLLPCSYLLPLAFTILLSFFCGDPWALGGGGGI